MTLRIGADVGGFPQAYPVQYEVLKLKDGAALKLTDAMGRKAEVALSADDARLLALGLLGALPPQSVSGTFGVDVARHAEEMHAEHHSGYIVPDLDSCPEHTRAEYEQMARDLRGGRLT